MIIYGKNPVKEYLLYSPGKIEEVYIYNNLKKETKNDIIQKCKNHRVKYILLTSASISKIAGTSSHQGVAAKVSDYKYRTLDELLINREKEERKGLILILDHIEDPQNLGAIIRSVNVLGADGIIIPKDRSTSVTPAVIKASAGAADLVPIVRVVNIVNQIKKLKKMGFWIVGADQNAKKSIFDEDDLGRLDLAIILGSEGKGISRLVKEHCDFLFRIPQAGEISSLNASVTAGIMIYEIMKQRSLKKY